MTEARNAFASRLNGRNYGCEMTDAESVEAKAARLLVVFGASDDLTEFRGIIHDEVGAYDGEDHFILQLKGQWAVFDGDPEEAKGVLIGALWCPDDLRETSWLIKPSVPHATFDILEDGELYCRGAVIDESDLFPAQRVLAASKISDIGRTGLFVEFAEPLTTADIVSVNEHLKGWSR